jgi:hypothetical protein
MRQFIAIAALTALGLSGCSTSPVDQVREIQTSTRCCIAPASLATTDLPANAPIDGVLDKTTALTEIGPARAPARAYRLPADAAGAVVEVTAYPDLGAVTKGRSLIFAPISLVFLNASGQIVAETEQTDFMPISGGQMYMFLVARQARVPASATTVVVISDPKEYGAQRQLRHRTSSHLVPVAGIFVPMAGADSVTAIWSPYGQFKLSLRR